MFQKIFCLLILFSSQFASAGDVIKDEIEGVKLESIKKDSTRIYKGSYSETFPTALNHVKSGIINFAQKCNNQYRDKRKFLDKKYDCKYLNPNVVETFEVKDINSTGWKKETDETERYLLGRQVYNRGSYQFYELVQVFESKNQQGQRTVRIIQKMLDDKQVKKFTTPVFEQSSVFTETLSTFILTELSPKKTLLEYSYQADTDHWLLNKEFSVSRVFESIGKSFKDLFTSIREESLPRSNDLPLKK